MTDKVYNKIIAVVGPTSSGKSSLAVEIAFFLNKNKRKLGIAGSEIVSADSRQIYRNLDIGSGRITKKEIGGIPHHLLSIISPKKIISVSEYQKRANKIIKKINKDNKIPILCGGAGLYIDSVIHQTKFPNVPPNFNLRRRLEKMSAQNLFLMLKEKDPRRAGNIDPQNKVRLIRALEIVISTKKPVPPKDDGKKFNFLKMGVKKERNDLDKAVRRRIKEMIKKGLVGEVKKLIRAGVTKKRINSLGFEYSIPLLFIEGRINKEEMMDMIVKENLRYAKRQMTWFKRDKEIIWIRNKKEAAKVVSSFLKH